MSYTQAELGVSTANTQNYDFANDYKDVELQKGKVIIHKDFEVQDTRDESLEPVRDRFRGHFNTLDTASFFNYVKSRTAEEGAELERTFVDAENPESSLTATTVLNFGNYENAGHADDIAVLKLRKDPLFIEFVRTTGEYLTATAFAEALENFLGGANVDAFKDGQNIGFAQAITGIRNAKIDKNSTSKLNTGPLGYEASDMEKIAIEAEGNTLATEFIFTTDLYLGLEEQGIRFRVDTHFQEKEGAGVAVFYRLKPIGLLAHYLIAADSFQKLIQSELDNVLIGTYSQRK